MQSRPEPNPLSRAERRCDLCLRNAFEQVCDHDRHGDSLITVVCTDCGLVSHASIPSEEELSAYYDSRYRHDYHGEHRPSGYRVAREWERCRQLAQRLTSHLKKTDSIIEIGAGIGCTVKNLELAGYNAKGIEPGVGFYNYARRTLRASVTQGTLGDLPHSPSYDVVLLVHVLEHLPAPRTALEHIWKMLRPGGRLYVEVPNLSAPHAAPGKMFHFAHIYNFTTVTLRVLGEVAGFDVEQLSHDDDKNLAMILSKSDRCRAPTDQLGFRSSVEALHRFNRLTYYLRWRYWASAAQRARTHYLSRIGTRRKVDAILQEIDRSP